MGGLTPVQVLEIVRGCRGLNIVGGDVAEVGDTIISNALCITIPVHTL